MPTAIRQADIEDLSFLEELETICFTASKRSNRRSLRLSIQSPSQEVLVLEQDGQRAGAAVLFLHKKSLRIYSIAVLPVFQRQGLGEALMTHIAARAIQAGAERITLEADPDNHAVIAWYRKQHFEITETVADYYAAGESALRMVRYMDEQDVVHGEDMAPNIIVVDNVKVWPLSIPNVEVVSAKQYLSEDRFHNANGFRVFNLCNSLNPHKLGYYVSLLASARDQRVQPSVSAIRDIATISLVQSVAEDNKALIQESLSAVADDQFFLNVFFGDTDAPSMSRLARLLHSLFELPLFRVEFGRHHGEWAIRKVRPLGLGSVMKQHGDLIQAFAGRFFRKKRFVRAKFKNYRYDLAILVNPDEPNPPSCGEALDLFGKAAEEVGFYTERITRQDYNRICEFDALFIRETTAVDNHTYTFARRAYADGLVVLDDPWSILRCTNKMYLYERLSRGRVRQPRSWLVCKERLNRSVLQQFPFPLVLKMPDSCFSLGVFKVNDPRELKQRLEEMFQATEVVVAQEYLTSEYDWRIGVLDNSPLFACKYYMAPGHWQVYNWQVQTRHRDEGQEGLFGRTETLPLNQVPPHVLQAAVRAASLVGDGIYGVDIKEKNGKAYVIEVNDNPNIDHGNEDAVLGEDLYRKIMLSFLNRIERERNMQRYVSFSGD